jgi:hypothetical protein
MTSAMRCGSFGHSVVLPAVRDEDDCVGEIGTGLTTVRVEVLHPPVTHEVKMKEKTAVPRTRGSVRRASGFIQIPLSQVPRREALGSTRTLGAGALVDRELRFIANYPGQKYPRWCCKVLHIDAKEPHFLGCDMLKG